MSECQKDMATLYPQLSQDALTATCAERWKKAVAAGPMSDAILAVVPTASGEPLALDAVRQRLPQVRWDARPQGEVLASGSMDSVSATFEGSVAALTRLNFGWQEVGGDPPYDMAGAMTARGASVKPLGCYHYGPSEVNRVFVVDAPGRAPFALTTYTRSAPLAYSHAYQTINADLTGKLPTLPGLQAEHTDPEWHATCPY